jgi:LPS-assembly lipoprotein
MLNWQNPISSLSLTVLLLLICIITACGFELRGSADLSFKTIFIQGKKISISKELQRSLNSNGVKVVEKVADAELVLELMSESYQKRILSLSGAGVVREFEITYLLDFRIRDSKNPLWGDVQSIRGRRDFSFSDSALLAKLEEEERLRQDMASDATRELLRRLTAYKPSNTQK